MQVLPIPITATYLYNPIPLGTLVANIYSTIHNWDFAQLPLFEIEAKFFGFFIWINSFLFFTFNTGQGKETK